VIFRIAKIEVEHFSKGVVHFVLNNSVTRQCL